MKKYELTSDSTVCRNETLYRIKALRDFGDVKAGDLGGYVAGEHNLAQHGDCWVYDEARVFENANVWGDARVYEDAYVYGTAKIYDYASVYGSACISGNAYISGHAEIYDNAYALDHVQICGNAQIYEHAVIYGEACIRGDAVIRQPNDIFIASYVGRENGTLTVANGKNGLVVTRGCFTGTVEEFLFKSEYYHDERIHNEYKMLIEVAKSRILNKERK